MPDRLLPSDATREARSAALRNCALFALAIVAFGSCLATRTSLFEGLETSVPLAGIAMAESARWIHPAAADPASAAPVLPAWLAAASTSSLEVGSWSARLPSVLALAAGAVALFLAARRLHGARAGLAAMLVFASAPLALVLGSLAVPDMIECACFCAILAAATELVTVGPGALWILVMAAAVALELLAAGPRGLWTVLPGLATALLLLSRSHIALRSRLQALGLALLGGAALYLAWAVPANRAAHGAVLHAWSDPLEPWRWSGAGLEPWIAVLALTVGFLPWAALLPAALAHASARRATAPQPFAIIAGFGVPLIALLVASGARRSVDLALLLPVASLALGGLHDAARAERIGATARAWLDRSGTLLGLLVAAFVVLVCVFRGRLPLDALDRGAPAIALLALACALYWLLELRAERWPGFLFAGVAANALLACAACVFLLRPFEEQKLAPRLLAWIRESAPPFTPVALYEVDGALYDFHAAPEGVRLQTAGDLRSFAAAGGQAVLVIPRTRALAERDLFRGGRWRELASVTGRDARTHAATEIVAIGRELFPGDR